MIIVGWDGGPPRTFRSHYGLYWFHYSILLHLRSLRCALSAVFRYYADGLNRLDNKQAVDLQDNIRGMSTCLAKKLTDLWISSLLAL